MTDGLDQLVEFGEIDWALDNNNGLVIRNDGDIALVKGVASIIQWTRIALGTPQGALLLHPNFGIGLKPGMSGADFDASTALGQLESMFAEKRSTIEITRALMERDGPALSLAIELGLRGRDIRVPVRYELK